MLLIGLFLGLTGRLEPIVVPDTPLYTEFSWDSPAAVLSDIRVPGYPAFLTLAAPGKNLSFVPTAHYVMYCLGVLVFAAGLKRLGIGAWMWVASALLYSNILHGYLATVASDTLAAAFAVASVGLLFLTLKSPGPLVPFGLCVTATWLIRPAYLSLVVQLPLLGAAIVMSRRAELPTARHFAKTAGILALATIVPLVAYCSLRGAVVGRFGVVASGGFNLIGITGQFLDEVMVDSLPDDLRALAENALVNGRSTGVNDPQWMANEPVLNYQRIENRYDRTIWAIFYPAAEQTGSSEVSSVNTRLRRLAQAIIHERPAMYAVYLAKAFRRAVYKIVGDTVLNPYCLTLCLLISGVVVLRIVTPSCLAWTAGRVGHTAGRDAATSRGHHIDQPSPHGGDLERSSAPPVGRDADFDALSIMVLTAVSHAAMAMAVVILVCPPLGRMTDGMALYAPALLMAFLVDRTHRLLNREAQHGRQSVAR